MLEAVVMAATVHCTFQGHPIKADNKADCRREKVVLWAKDRKDAGAQYVWAADGPNSFDCSGFTMWSYRKVGVNLPHFSGAQMDRGKSVSKKNLKPGDLLFYGAGGGSHVSMYIGHGKMIHASNPGRDIVIDNVYWSGFAGALRYIK